MRLSDLIKVIEIKIPGTDVVVKMKDELSWYESQESLKIEGDNERGIFVLYKMIQEWNIEDKGKIIPISENSIKILPGNIIRPLVDKANELTVAKSEKKKK